jgi:choline dehydrogenase-like flavoprotein
MQIDNLASLDASQELECDLVIIGGGPAGLTLAKSLFDTPLKIIVLESGLTHEDPAYNAYLRVENIGDPVGPVAEAKRATFHGEGTTHWDVKEQGYGVRCRLLGGSTHAWAGKSATFDAIDFEARDWVPHSGWPVSRDSLIPYFDRAAEELNLGPNCYDEGLFKLMGTRPPEPQIDKKRLRPFFWQFARSRIDKMDIMRFGPEFQALEAKNVRVLINATVTHINTNKTGSAFDSLEVSTRDGVRYKLKAKTCVLAASGIENARLLLASNRQNSGGLGNAYGVVGRYLMDHPGLSVASFGKKDMNKIATRFGFYGLNHQGRTHMYMYGLSIAEELQRKLKLLNCAVYMMGERALDDPFDAVKRIIKRESKNLLADIFTILKSPGTMIKGIGMKMLGHRLFPGFLRDFIINTVIMVNPNFAASEFQSRGLPHKLTGMTVDAITEQAPNPESRITLSEKTDVLGVPMARVQWSVTDKEKQSFAELGRLLLEEFPKAGLPAPTLEPWIANGRPQDAIAIDMGHTSGTTRMSNDPRTGVVDTDCQVFGVSGLYVAGSSIFPTSGHANPTLMILSFTLRLSDHLKSVLLKA